MSSVDIILVGAVVLLIFMGIVHFLVSRTRLIQLENRVETNRASIGDLKDLPSTQYLSSELVELHRKVTTLQTVVEALGLRLTDVSDTVEHRYNRLRMRQQRAEKEGEEEPEVVDDETQLQLLEDLNGETPQQLEPQARRGRLVPKHSRERYPRR